VGTKILIIQRLQFVQPIIYLSLARNPQNRNEKRF